MSMIETLDRLYESGELRDLIRGGLIAPNVLYWRKVFKCYENEISKGVTKMQAVENVCEVFKIEQRTVYRILKRMKK